MIGRYRYVRHVLFPVPANCRQQGLRPHRRVRQAAHHRPSAGSAHHPAHPPCGGGGALRGAHAGGVPPADRRSVHHADNVNFDDDAIRRFADRVTAERDRLGGGETPVVDLWKGETDIVSLRSTLLFGMKGMAAYAHHALNLGCGDAAVTDWFYKGLCAVNRPHTVEQWLALIMEFGQVNFRCMALLDRANTGAFGDPDPRG